MIHPFSLRRTIAKNVQANPKDIVDVKKALYAVGQFQPGEFGFTDFTEGDMFEGIKAVQRLAGLEPTGEINPGDETEDAMRKIVSYTHNSVKYRGQGSGADDKTGRRGDLQRTIPILGSLDLGRPTSEGEKLSNDRRSLFGNSGEKLRVSIEPKFRQNANSDLPRDVPLDFWDSVFGNDETKERVARAKAAAKSEKPLPPPTNEAVDLEEYFDILAFDPTRPDGDYVSIPEFRRALGIIYSFRTEATKIARRMIPTSPDGRPLKGFDDAQDAFRHALFSFLVTRKFGPQNAKLITDRHERLPIRFRRNKPGSLLQDLYNNRAGKDAALDPKNDGRKPEEVVFELYKTGRLQESPFRLRLGRHKR